MGETYNLYDPAYSTTGAYNATIDGSTDYSYGWSQTLQDIARIGASTYAKTTLMQQNINGQRYIEGQRLAALQNATGIKPGMLLLIGAGALFYMLAK